jgi:hypothetical protein
MEMSIGATITKARVRRVNGAYALMANCQIAKDEVIFHLQGEINDKPSKRSLQVEKNEHLEPLSYDPSDLRSLISFFNHSCDPSAYICFEDYTVRALRDLEPDEEVTFNYNTTEYEMANPFKCQCDSKSCLVDIRGFKYLSFSERMKLTAPLAPHLQQISPANLLRSGW